MAIHVGGDRGATYKGYKSYIQALSSSAHLPRGREVAERCQESQWSQIKWEPVSLIN